MSPLLSHLQRGVGRESPVGEVSGVKNGTYTMTSDRSGEHRTFRVRTVHDGNLKGQRVIGLLTGSDNTSDYQNFGFVDPSGIRMWSKSRGTALEAMARVLWRVLTAGQVQPDGSVRLAGVNGCVLFQSACCVCNRPLTDPDSIRNGIGPTCAARGGI